MSSRLELELATVCAGALASERARAPHAVEYVRIIYRFRGLCTFTFLTGRELQKFVPFTLRKAQFLTYRFALLYLDRSNVPVRWARAARAS